MNLFGLYFLFHWSFTTGKLPISKENIFSKIFYKIFNK